MGNNLKNVLSEEMAWLEFQSFKFALTGGAGRGLLNTNYASNNEWPYFLS